MLTRWISLLTQVSVIAVSNSRNTLQLLLLISQNAIRGLLPVRCYLLQCILFLYAVWSVDKFLSWLLVIRSHCKILSSSDLRCLHLSQYHRKITELTISFRLSLLNWWSLVMHYEQPDNCAAVPWLLLFSLTLKKFALLVLYHASITNEIIYNSL